jgi:hypothetical protein
MTDPNSASIHYFRVLRTPENAVWGELTVNGVTFVAVENRSVSSYNSVPAGVYQLKMDTKNSGTPCKCLRFTEVPGRKGGAARPFLIHRAYGDNWTDLAGCIAPGMAVQGGAKGMQLTQSEAAMDKLFELLGGYEKDKTCYIHIDNHAPGDKWTREEFIERRSKRLSTVAR